MYSEIFFRRGVTRESTALGGSFGLNGALPNSIKTSPVAPFSGIIQRRPSCVFVSIDALMIMRRMLRRQKFNFNSIQFPPVSVALLFLLPPLARFTLLASEVNAAFRLP